MDLGVCFYLQIWLCANGDSNPHLPPQHDAAETAKDLISLELPSQSASPPPDEDEAEVQAAEDGISTEEEEDAVMADPETRNDQLGVENDKILLC